MTRLKLAAFGLSLVLVAGALAAGAMADTGLVTGTVAAGTLSEVTAAAPTFSVSLDGTDQTASYTLPITLTDSRGTGLGWNMTITSTQFTTGGASPNTLPTSASTITAVSSSCKPGSTCTNPTNSVTYPLGLPSGATAPTAVKLMNAALLTGLGKFTVTPTVSVSVPANSFAGTYTSTITLAVVSGP